jgi:Tol biopolymer transport system component
VQITRESGAPEQPVSNPQWSPDGRFVAYQAVGGLFVIDPCGRPVRLAAEVSNYSWSNDSTRIASDNSEGIFIADSMSAVLRGVRLAVFAGPHFLMSQLAIARPSRSGFRLSRISDTLSVAVIDGTSSISCERPL